MFSRNLLCLCFTLCSFWILVLSYLLCAQLSYSESAGVYVQLILDEGREDILDMSLAHCRAHTHWSNLESPIDLNTFGLCEVLSGRMVLTLTFDPIRSRII